MEAAAARPLAPPTGRSTVRVASISAITGAVVAALVSFATVRVTERDSTAPARSQVAAAPLETTAPEPNPVGGPVTSVAVADIQDLLLRVSPSVVAIEVRTSQGAAAGSGVVISADGLIVTNAHVVADATAITIRDGSGQTHGADLVGSSPKSDIALVRQRDAKGLKPAALGQSSSLHVGDEVVAIGNAYDLGDTPTVTKGIISAKGRTLDTGEVKLENLLQTDAAINHGNSGGPLLNMSGEVIGINSAGIPNANNLGFAIEIDAVKPLIEKLRAGQGDVKTTAFLGVATIAAVDLDAATRSRLGVTATTGAVITSVTAGSAAKDGGLKEGDVIVAIDTRTVTGPPEIRDVLAAKKPGEPVALDIDRRGEHLTVAITLGSRVVSNA